jgi:dTDP-4-dehydrorhamnose reductase
MMPKILITGKNGQVGFELQRALAPLGEIVAVDRSECDHRQPGRLHGSGQGRVGPRQRLFDQP